MIKTHRLYIFIILFSILLIRCSSTDPFNTIMHQASNQGFSGIVSYQDQHQQHIFISKGPQKFDTDTLFAIGSVSKLFTQLAIMQLVEAGKINLHNTVDHYLDPATLPQAWKSWLNIMTVEQLMEHTSGLPEMIYPNEDVAAIFNHVKENKTLVEHFHTGENALFDKQLLTKNLSQSSVEGIYYSNVGYNLLALIVENVSKLPYDEYLRDHIFKPTKMTRTFSGTQKSNSLYEILNQHKNIAIPMIFSVRFSNKLNNNQPSVLIDPHTLTPERDYNFAFAYGAGSIFSTINDLQHWLKTLFETSNLLKTKKAKQQLINFDLDENLWGHQGELPGYQSIVLANPKSKTYLIILSNLNYDMYALSDELSKISSQKDKHHSFQDQKEFLEDAFEEQLEKYPYLTPAKIAKNLLSE